MIIICVYIHTFARVYKLSVYTHILVYTPLQVRTSVIVFCVCIHANLCVYNVFVYTHFWCIQTRSIAMFVYTHWTLCTRFFLHMYTRSSCLWRLPVSVELTTLCPFICKLINTEMSISKTLSFSLLYAGCHRTRTQYYVMMTITRSVLLRLTSTIVCGNLHACPVHVPRVPAAIFHINYICFLVKILRNNVRALGRCPERCTMSSR